MRTFDFPMIAGKVPSILTLGVICCGALAQTPGAPPGVPQDAPPDATRPAPTPAPTPPASDATPPAPADAAPTAPRAAPRPAYEPPRGDRRCNEVMVDQPFDPNLPECP